MGFIKKEIVIGTLISLAATLAGFYIYLEYISRFGFQETISMIKQGGVLGPLLALCSLPNLFVFFIFLKKNQEYRARGVLIGVIIIALFTAYLKFF